MGLKVRKRPTSTSSKKFLLLTQGFEKPTPEVMKAWGAWFASIADRIVDQGGLWGGGRQFTKKASKPLPFGKDSITGYLIFTAASKEEAETLARGCPVVASNSVYEIMSK